MIYTIYNQRFGVEIETVGCERAKIAKAIAEVVIGQISLDPTGAYNATLVTQTDGRIWRIQNDASVATVNGVKGSEIISPILLYSDIENLQKIVRAVRNAGCKTSSSCSVHVHVEGAPHTPQTLSNLAKLYYRNEDLLFQAVGTLPSRKVRFTKPMEQDFIDRIASSRPTTMDEFNKLVFGQYTPHPEHYNNSRYRAINWVNLWRPINTVEFRLYNSTLNALKVTAWVQLSLALSVRALNMKQTTHTKINTDNPKFNFRVFLVSSLGMIGNEFKSTRSILLKNLPGNSAWRYGKPENHVEVANAK